MLIREYHGFTVISAREEEPSKDGDGWDHAVVFKDGSVMAPFGTLAEAVAVCKLAAEKAEEEAKELKRAEAAERAHEQSAKDSRDDTERQREELNLEPVAEAPAELPVIAEAPVAE